MTKVISYQSDRPIIIAEAGVNHNGSLDTAMRLVDAAAMSGADYIKFQTFKAEKLVTHNCATADYQQNNTGDTSQLEMLRRLELSYDDFIRLNEYCHEKGIGFLSTPVDEESLEFLVGLKPDYIKLPSGEITNLPYLRKVATYGIPVIMSTGMCSLSEIEDALHPFKEAGYDKSKIILLHCTTQYPAPYSSVNLRAMKTMAKRFGLSVGYSDHTKGVEVSIAAAALGACVIEKHFTLSRNMEGPDHTASLEPHELKEMVRMVRNVVAALGSEEKFMTETEGNNAKVARRSIVASRLIKAGEVIKGEDITAKRPGTGLSPMQWDSVVGSVAKMDFLPDQQIEL